MLFMLKRIMIGALATATMNGTAHAYMLIDDFTVGEHHGVVNWPNTTDQHEQAGLDKSHTLFGSRSTFLDVMSNFNHVPLNVDLAQGVAKVSYSSHSMATQFDINFGYDRRTIIDFSAEAEFWVDQITYDPAGRLADEWRLTFMDTLGRVRVGGGFISRPGGIKFKKANFAGDGDWSLINFVQLKQKYSPDDGTVPTAYAVTKIYSVPEVEPMTTLLFLVLGASLRAKRACRLENS